MNTINYHRVWNRLYDIAPYIHKDSPKKFSKFVEKACERIKSFKSFTSNLNRFHRYFSEENINRIAKRAWELREKQKEDAREYRLSIFENSPSGFKHEKVATEYNRLYADSVKNAFEEITGKKMSGSPTIQFMLYSLVNRVYHINKKKRKQAELENEIIINAKWEKIGIENPTYPKELENRLCDLGGGDPVLGWEYYQQMELSYLHDKAVA